ncbi:MAG: hypothetical protein JWN52_714 [Actinomycetia bacterium]|nr:hypothetical protein [Actinomycetes bacterium]
MKGSLVNDSPCGPNGETDVLDLETPSLTLALSGWLIRAAEGAGGRPALEVHSRERLVDVSVATPLVTDLLRGGRRSPTWSVAWGQLPPHLWRDPKAKVEVRFAYRAWRRASLQVGSLVVGGAYWVAEAPGDFRTVLASAEGAEATLRLRRS